MIKMDMLKHPIFKALLDQAQDAYDFCSGPLRLWIQCDENTFLDVVCCRALLSIEGTALACTCENGDIFF